MNWFQKLLSNPFLLIGLSSWFWAQLIKTIIHAIVTKSIDFTRLIGDGGAFAVRYLLTGSFAERPFGHGLVARDRGGARLRARFV